jgi:tripartite-type tricarboxylate transporter receptor subunit TctC
MADELKQGFIVDNKSGATGTVAIPEVLRQPADGYTIYAMNSASLLGPVLYPSANIDFIRDFVPVGTIDTSASILVTSPSKPFNKISDIVEAAKAKPDSLTYASAGAGSPPHVVAEQFKIVTGTQIRHIPYQQINQLLADLTTGTVDIAFMGAPVSIPQIQGGRLKGLGINTKQRSKLLPDVPTFEEAGLKGMDIRAFDGFLVKKGTPQEVIKTLSESMHHALKQESVRQALEKSGLEVLDMQTDEFDRYLKRESDRLQTLGRQIGVRAE